MEPVLQLMMIPIIILSVFFPRFMAAVGIWFIALNVMYG